MPRVSDWEHALSSYVSSTADLAHCSGSHDCALDCADAVMAMTQVDFAAEFRGRYRSTIGAQRVLKRYGRGTLERTLDAKFPTVAPGFARRGDLAFHDGSLGIVMGPFALFLVEGQTGRVRVSRADWQKAWSIG